MNEVVTEWSISINFYLAMLPQFLLLFFGFSNELWRTAVCSRHPETSGTAPFRIDRSIYLFIVCVYFNSLSALRAKYNCHFTFRRNIVINFSNPTVSFSLGKKSLLLFSNLLLCLSGTTIIATLLRQNTFFKLCKTHHTSLVLIFIWFSWDAFKLCLGRELPSVTEKTGPGIFAIKAELVDLHC